MFCELVTVVFEHRAVAFRGAIPGGGGVDLRVTRRSSDNIFSNKLRFGLVHADQRLMLKVKDSIRFFFFLDVVARGPSLSMVVGWIHDREEALLHLVDTSRRRPRRFSSESKGNLFKIPLIFL
jgi:hypothetical protein